MPEVKVGQGCAPFTGAGGRSFLLLPAPGGPGVPGSWPHPSSLCSNYTWLLLCLCVLYKVPPIAESRVVSAPHSSQELQLFFFLPFFFRATPTAYGGSQARG